MDEWSDLNEAVAEDNKRVQLSKETFYEIIKKKQEFSLKIQENHEKRVNAMGSINVKVLRKALGSKHNEKERITLNFFTEAIAEVFYPLKKEDYDPKVFTNKVLSNEEEFFRRMKIQKGKSLSSSQVSLVEAVNKMEEILKGIFKRKFTSIKGLLETFRILEEIHLMAQEIKGLKEQIEKVRADLSRKGRKELGWT